MAGQLGTDGERQEGRKWVADAPARPSIWEGCKGSREGMQIKREWDIGRELEVERKCASVQVTPWVKQWLLDTSIVFDVGVTCSADFAQALGSGRCFTPLSANQ
jgi:hypothetical protein